MSTTRKCNCGPVHRWDCPTMSEWPPKQQTTTTEQWITQAELDEAARELGRERVERVWAWDRARATVKLRRENLRQCLREMRGLETYGEAHALLAALDELERLEEGGV